MNKEELTQKKLSITDQQLVNAIIDIAATILLAVVLLDQRKQITNEKGFLNNNQAQTLALTNKIIVFLAVVWAIYINYKARSLAIETNEETSLIELQILAAVIALIPAGIGIYVVLKDFQSTSLQPAETANPFA